MGTQNTENDQKYKKKNLILIKAIADHVGHKANVLLTCIAFQEFTSSYSKREWDSLCLKDQLHL